MAVKRSSLRRRFSINFKLRCIHQYTISENISQTALANGISRSTLRNWIKYKRFLEEVYQKRKLIVILLIFTIFDLT